MPTHRSVCIQWLLLLLHVSGSAARFNLFKTNSDPQEGDVRLFGTKSTSEGRVEVYHSGKWGTVCDDGWDMSEAQVVCRQLHFPRAKSVVIGKNYGEASGPIWLDDINCKGTETHLFTCNFKDWGVTDCSHKEDVGVICETGSNMTIIDSTHGLDHSFSLSDDLGQLFDRGSACDFLILVKSATGNRQEDGTPEMGGKTICVHKMILSQFPLFEASEGISNITIEIDQSCQPYFTSFIRYIYTRKIDVTFSSVQCLHWMASKFGVKQLMEDTGRLFSEVLPEDTSFHTQVSLYKYAEEMGDLVLRENCIQYMAWNYQMLARSSAWADLSVDLMGALLNRNDLVVPDEYYLLQTIESWITEKGSSISLETQADLLNRIRFPMIPVEQLYELEFNSTLYSTHQKIYQDNMWKAFRFNLLLFRNLLSNPNFNREDDDYQPRIYITEPWSIALGPMSLSTSQSQTQTRHTSSYYRRGRYSYGNNYYSSSRSYSPVNKMFSTPVHSSLIFRDNKIQWEATILRSQSECSNRGVSCTSLPMARLVPQSSNFQQSNITFHNRLLLVCQDNYIFQVQDFKVNQARVATNGTQVFAYPCPEDNFIFHFVVRPHHV